MRKMKNIDDIIKNDSAFFHKLIKGLVEPLNFGPGDAWYETISFGGLVKVFNTREELDTSFPSQENTLM